MALLQIIVKYVLVIRKGLVYRSLQWGHALGLIVQGLPVEQSLTSDLGHNSSPGPTPCW